ncbi:MAG: glycosyltransferase family 2 protein [Parvibaculaceae bacterium]
MTEVWSIVIPTYHRPKLLRKALSSCRAQKLGEMQTIEVVVVDNSPEGNAADTCQALQMDNLRYVHEPRAGLVFARNSGIEAASGDFLAFLDDDEEAEEDWILELSIAFRKSGADIVCGAVLPKLEDPAIEHYRYVTNFYSRDVSRPAYADIGDILNYVGTGNSAFRRPVCFGDGVRFDPRFNHFGGEDIELFRSLKRKGHHFAWAPNAKVHEWVSKERTGFSYLRQRRRAQGQQRVDGLWRSGLWGRVQVPLFMLGGGGQAALHSLRWLFHSFAGNKVQMQLDTIEAQGGLGKIFWIGAARQKRYGASVYE